VSKLAKKAANTRRRNAANKPSQSQDDNDQSSKQSNDDNQPSKQPSHGKMHRPTKQSHEEHVKAGKKGADSRWGKGSTGRSSGKQSGLQVQDEAKQAIEELSKDPKIQSLKEKQNGEREQEIKECQQLLQQAFMQSSKPHLALMMNPKGKNLIQVIRMEHRLVEQLGERLTSMLTQSGDQTDDAILGMAFNIMKLLSIHAACEEMVVYPMLKSKGHNALAKQALEEHTQMKSDLVELDTISNQQDQSEFLEKLQKCLDDTLHHVTEEEDSLLPLIESLNSQSEIDQMLVQFLEGHMKSPTRPHLDAPTEPPANIEKNVEVAKMDMQMDIDEGRFEIPAM